MRNLYNKMYQTVGNTPLVRLEKVSKELGVNLFAKLESRNPGFSVKDRIAYGMLNDAISTGKLKEGMKIIEPTSGNTGIALAMMGASLGFKVTLVMPESMSVERRAMMKYYGADFILTPAEKGMKGAIDKATEVLKETPEKYFMPQQFENPANPKIHEATTGPEIFRDLQGNVDFFVAGVGTGGTISGTSRYLKSVSFKSVTSVAVEPAKSPAITKYLSKEDFAPAPHKIQGIGAGFIPKNLDLNVVDHILTIDDEEAIEAAKELAFTEGIAAGISSGANFEAAKKVAKNLAKQNDNIVFIVCDTGERYLSTDLFVR
ncbi:cysteine synthase A [Deferribacterales bacterium Es71-Z0220]|jgi:cysteine synthase A|uniref:cysteine synthase A n=1 Tax=Deferrivibrio essentukiensis TaxID=2880922 RepID=UPI001F61F906|nr:cysteine synthase A [Deferrivibrio essentukiensis]MBZ4672693.1 cysteine synthase [Deferribacteraceae bacterium]MCB4203411.1 cysteine synthase A [Deferrivibrio essentukiensis]